LRILLAVDGSTFSDAAAQLLIKQAKPQDTEVLVLYVIEILSPSLPEIAAYYPGIEHARDAQIQPAQALVAKTAELLRSHGLRATTSVEVGDPKSKIIDVAKDWRADLIVVGSHGRASLYRFLMGSVSDTVTRHAPCSVQIVRMPKE
jgi:nucleotide-binding universal stress UspA family protein